MKREKLILSLLVIGIILAVPLTSAFSLGDWVSELFGKDIKFSPPKVIIPIDTTYEDTIYTSKTKTVTCHDTDGGTFVGQKGSIIYNQTTVVKGKNKSIVKTSYTDKCSKSNKTVAEWYCNNITKNAKYVTYNCENGCKDGACLSAQNTPFEKIIYNGDLSKKVNIFFAPSDYTNYSQWIVDLNEFILSDEDGLFSYAPLKSYNTSFNIWSIYNSSFTVINNTLMIESGELYTTGLENEVKGLIQDYIGDRSYVLAFIHNNPSTSIHGGMAGYLDGKGLIILQKYTGSQEIGYSLNKKTLAHEFGHAFLNFGDEYENQGAIQDFSNRPNIDREGCPKWCSGIMNISQQYYSEYLRYKECVINVSENYTIFNYNASACFYLYDSRIAQVDFGTRCTNGTGCFWNAKSVINFRSSEENIMRYPEVSNEFSELQRIAIINRINNLTR